MNNKTNSLLNINPIYASIQEILNEARSRSYRAINFYMVKAYWEIGKLIFEEEQQGRERAGYGEGLLKDLSKRLTEDFGKGFSLTNLKYMRLFYVAFPIGHALRDQLSWTHYCLLIGVTNTRAREYYLNEAIEQNWSTRALERQINSFYYERILASKNDIEVKKEADIATKPLVTKPEDLIKDPYILEFLSLNKDMRYLEKDLEQGLIDKLQQFLLELGKGFCFVSRQKSISLEGDHFYIDLVFYNYILKCFVLVDLKLGSLTHQDIGQMQMYVNYYDRELLNEGDSKTIGIILCADKKESVVKYTLPKGSKNIFTSKYKLCLPTEEELRQELERGKSFIEQEKALAS
jgi:predicted nuclease of restriction endonuclease-like (RecB) superfamily